MPYFTQVQAGSTLFVGQPPSGTVGYVAAVFPAVPPRSAYEIPDVLGTTAASASLDASIVFLQQPIGTTPAAQSAFVKAVADLIAAQGQGATRVMAWATSPTTLPSATVTTLGPSGGDSVTMTSALTLYTGMPVTITVAANQPWMAPDDTSIALTWQQPPVFNGLSAVPYVNKPVVTVPFTGSQAFGLQFLISVAQTALDSRNFGFAFGAAPPGSANQPEQLLYAPLIAPDVQQTPYFNATFDPIDLYNAANPDRTTLAFLGRNFEATESQLNSCYVSPTGIPIVLTPVVPATALDGDQPARLVFVAWAYRDNTPAIFTLAPEGDYELNLSPGMPQTPQLMCGLQGMEYIQFTPATGAGSSKVPGDRLRFVSGAPAYAPIFPFPVASPTAPPFDPTASPMTTHWTTSYATLRQPSTGDAASALVVAQPPGFQLYGVGGTVDNKAHPHLLGSQAPGSSLVAAPTHPFPLVPYQRVASTGSPLMMNAQQVAAFEANVLSPLRTTALAADAGPLVAGAATATFVTPGGYLIEVTYSKDGRSVAWTRILLGTVGTQSIAFDNPTAELVSAFSTGSLMLVIANAAHLVQPGGGKFDNTLSLGGWTFQANVAGPDTFGDYRNIVIVKGVPGALATLAQNPANWTNPATFASPVTATPGQPDPGQLVNVGQWLQTYIAAAAAVTGPDAQYFADFNTIVNDPNWTGVLILRADITGIPQSIAGILAGITDFSNFNVHHLAIPVVPATAPPAPQQSPVSGLIYYNPFPDADPEHAVPTDPSRPYGFQLNSLKVTFQNGAVQTFSSYAQITLRSLFGSDVIRSDAGYQSVVLTGTYQLVDNQPVYSMSTATETTMALDCAVLKYVDVTGVQMSTVQAVPNGNTVSVFSIVGYLDFALLPGPSGTTTIDLFSYGRDPSGPPAGLAFQNLVLTMTFATPPPGQPPSGTPAFTLASNALRFDTATSYLRKASLVRELSLQVTSLLVAQTSAPGQQGYLPVITVIPAGDLGDGAGDAVNFNALTFNLDMGTPGQLAAKAGLTASLMLAWNPTSNTEGTWDVQIGLQLPGTAQGAPLISLQTVLHLSIGQISLQYATSADGTRQGFLLMLDEIALSFLGLLKFPPNGATSFYLFGDPAGVGNSLGWYAQYLKSGDNA